jgi:nucleoside triphosphate pyrophosphatase
MKLPRVILASASPRRSELLKQLGLKFEVIPGQAEEIAPAHLSPHEICQVNAHRKARVVARANPRALVIGADTIVCLGKKLFGKPRNEGEARRMLEALAGKTHQVITGVCLIELAARREKLFAVNTMVIFRPLTGAQIREYVKTVHTLDKAGAYAIQERGDTIIDKINGSYSNVVGLPLERLGQELRDWRNA